MASSSSFWGYSARIFPGKDRLENGCAGLRSQTGSTGGGLALELLHALGVSHRIVVTRKFVSPHQGNPIGAGAGIHG